MLTDQYIVIEKLKLNHNLNLQPEPPWKVWKLAYRVLDMLEVR